MAINSTRGLPSFSEMYSAFKNKGSLGETLQAGVEGYKTGVEMKRKNAAQESQSALEQAQAKKALHEATTEKATFVRIDQITDPKEKAELAQYATPNTEGIMVVPTSTYNAVTKRTQGAEMLDLKAQHDAAMAAKDADLARAAQEKQALLNEIGPKAQSISAAKGLAESAGKVGEPSLAGRLVNPLQKLVTGTDISSVAAEKQREAANARLQTLMSNAQGAVTDNAVGIQPTPNYTSEAEALAAGHKKGDRVMINNVPGTLH